MSTKTIRIKREKFGELLKNCEHYMWVAVGWKGGKGVSMGKNAGTEFVDSVFSRDRAEGGKGRQHSPQQAHLEEPNWDLK